MNKHIVSEAEAGVRVLRFLERRLGLPRPLLYRWLRSGQVRVNKGRVKADYLLGAGDELRLPPQAVAALPGQTIGQTGDKRCILPQSTAARQGLAPAQTSVLSAPAVPEFKFDAPQELGPGLRLLQANKHVLLLCKGSGLPVQPGSGHTDSVSERLKALAGSGEVAPVPAHRLDKQSSGLLVAGRTHISLRRLQALFSQAPGAVNRLCPQPSTSLTDKALNADSQQVLPKAEAVAKLSGSSCLERRYLVWVTGDLRLPDWTLLEDYLAPATGADGRERMAVAESGRAGVKLARSLYRTLRFMPVSPCGPASLLEVQLLTGRKHQIRVQCASRGYPVIGDRRYAGPFFERLLLHAYKLVLPGGDFMGEHFAAVHGFVLPDWSAPFAVEEGIVF